MSQYFKDCTKAPSNRRTLFTAPFDQKTADGLEEGDLIEIHPAILKFNTVLKKDAKGMGYTSRYKIGNADYDNLSKIRSENAFNPPLNKAKIFETEWTKETLRDFSLNRHLYYLYQVNEDEDKRYLRIGKSKPDTKATLQEEGKAITVGDVLESIIADFEFHPDFQHNSHQWDSMESFLELLRKKGKIPEQIKEDSGWGSPFNWLDHLGRLEQEEWLEHLFRDSSDDLLTYRIWPHLEYRLEKGESADLPLEFGFRLVETRVSGVAVGNFGKLTTESLKSAENLTHI